MKIKVTIEYEPLEPYNREAVAVTCTNEGISCPNLQIKFVEVQDGEGENRSSNVGGE